MGPVFAFFSGKKQKMGNANQFIAVILDFYNLISHRQDHRVAQQDPGSWEGPFELKISVKMDALGGDEAVELA